MYETWKTCFLYPLPDKCQIWILTLIDKHKYFEEKIATLFGKNCIQIKAHKNYFCASVRFNFRWAVFKSLYWIKNNQKVIFFFKFWKGDWFYGISIINLYWIFEFYFWVQMLNVFKTDPQTLVFYSEFACLYEILSSLIIRIQNQSCLVLRETSVKTVNFARFSGFTVRPFLMPQGKEWNTFL